METSKLYPDILHKRPPPLPNKTNEHSTTTKKPLTNYEGEIEYKAYAEVLLLLPTNALSLFKNCNFLVRLSVRVTSAGIHPVLSVLYTGAGQNLFFKGLIRLEWRPL